MCSSDLGSGNIFSAELAKTMFDRTSCDGILVARGSFGNPWIFKDIHRYLKYGKKTGRVSLREKGEVLKRHLLYLNTYLDCHPSSKAGIMKRVAMWYIRNISNAKELRREITIVKDYKKMIKLIDNIIDR